MPEPYIGEIRMFAGNFAPSGWMFCQGQIIAISEYVELFNVIGTTHGGDGLSTFVLPDLRGRLPLHQGAGFALGETGGTEDITLTTAQVPAHSHTMLATTAPATTPNPANALPATGVISELYWGDPPGAYAAPNAVGAVGGSQPHTNFQPYLCVNFIISLFGRVPT